jgi:hypothetical protein
VTLHPLSLACMFVYSSGGKWVFPPLLWSFPPTTAFTSFPAPDCWACAAAPAGLHVYLQLMWEVGLPPSPVEFSSLHHSHKVSRSWRASAPALSSQAQLAYSQFWEGFPFPPSFLLSVFIVLIAYYSVSLFSQLGGWSVQGLC